MVVFQRQPSSSLPIPSSPLFFPSPVSPGEALPWGSCRHGKPAGGEKLNEKEWRVQKKRAVTRSKTGELLEVTEGDHTHNRTETGTETASSDNRTVEVEAALGPGLCGPQSDGLDSAGFCRKQLEIDEGSEQGQFLGSVYLTSSAS